MRRLGIDGILIGTAAVLSVLYVVMWLTGEVKWSLFDFAVAGVLLSSAGLAVKLLFTVFTKPAHRLIVGAAIFFALFLVWVEIAVGLFGTRFAGS
jgi:hypothetical protein